jgi:hypothetical protein
MSKETDPIWINNIQILLNVEKLTDFFPSKNQTQAERINSIVRLSFYVSLLLAVYHSNFKYFYIFIFFILFTYILYSNKNEQKNELKQSEELQKINAEIQDNPQQMYEDMLNNFEPKLEQFTEKLSTEKLSTEKLSDDILKTQAKCYQPTQQNPFMNATMEDYLTFDNKGNIVDRPPACNPNDPSVKRKIDTLFDNNLFKDITDVWGKVNSQRNFYTNPSTTIPNDRDAFANWLYKTPKTCKEDQEFCSSLNFEDLRSNRFIFPNPTENPVVPPKK